MWMHKELMSDTLDVNKNKESVAWQLRLNNDLFYLGNNKS